MADIMKSLGLVNAEEKEAAKDVKASEETAKAAAPSEETIKHDKRLDNLSKGRAKGSKNKNNLVGDDKNIVTFNAGNLYEYLVKMAKYNDVTITKYIQKLIIDDKAAHEGEFEALKTLSRYEHIKIPRHTKDGKKSQIDA